MRLWLALLIWLSALPALAQAIMVKSGEHAGFSRLVLDVPVGTPWTFGRVDDGYALRLPPPARSYDLAQVYEMIPPTRLASIRAEPASGDLRLGVGCRCHAVAYQFRPGMLVIDLRDGPAPAGSSFELALDGGPVPALDDAPPPGPPADPGPTGVRYDWIAASRAAPADPETDVDAPPASLPQPQALADLRAALLSEVSRGAAEGIVEPADRLPPPPASGPPAQVRIGAGPGIAATTRRTENRLVASGAPCIADNRLDVAAWGGDGPVAEQFAVAQQGLAGEFDAAQPEAVARAVRFYLQAGFGAEATQLMRAFGATGDDAPLWASMARIVDGGLDEGGAFAGMETCDTVAALWAVLALDAVPAGPMTNRVAVRRAFSALPLPLRRHLGPPLADRFLAAGDAETARAIRDAVLRAETVPDPQLALMSAALDLAEGDRTGGEARLEAMIADPGPTVADALLALVESRIAAAAPIDAPTVTALAALLHERGGMPEEPRLRRAHLLAQALSGDYDGAFAALPTMPDATADLHRLLAEVGPDSAVLVHAVRPEEAALPDAEPAVRRRLAERLTALGMGDAALRWLAGDTGAPVMTRAGAELRRGDPAAALRALDGEGSPDALMLLATAQTRLGDLGAAAATLAKAGDAEAATEALIRDDAWTLVAARDDGSPWATAARLVTAPPALQAEAGPLARSAAIIAESATARETLRALLTAVAAPDAP